MKSITSCQKGFTLIELMIVVGLIGMLGALAIPNIIKSRDFSRTNACINNLREIDSAKQQFALEKGIGLAVTPNNADLQPYMGRGQAGTIAGVHCPLAAVGPFSGYTVNNIGTLPQCNQFGGVHLATIQ